jgi:serine/threonine protein phosphatase PrpC
MALDFLNTCLVRKSDTVYAMAQLNGNRLDLAHTGDCRYLLIRKGLVALRSQIYSSSRQAFIKGEISTEEYYTKACRDYLTSTLGYSFIDGRGPDIKEGIELKDGDILVMLSDGGSALLEKEIISAVSDVDCERAVKNLELIIAQKNRDGYYEVLVNGEIYGAIAPRDHVTVCVYKHKAK